MLISSATHLDAVKDQCFGMWSVGGTPDSANEVRLRVGSTAINPRQHYGSTTLTKGKLRVVGEIDVKRISQWEMQIIVE